MKVLLKQGVVEYTVDDMRVVWFRLSTSYYTGPWKPIEWNGKHVLVEECGIALKYTLLEKMDELNPKHPVELY